MRGNSQNGGQTTKSLLIKPQCSGVPIQQAVSLSSSFPRHCLLFVCAFFRKMQESAGRKNSPCPRSPVHKNRPGFLLRKPGRFICFMGAFSSAQYLFEVLVISVFRGLSVHFSERFFQADHCFFDDFCLIGRAICKLFGHPAVEHRLCFFDLDAK